MSTISSSSSYSTSSFSSRGMAGLVSGIDTESMVESMLSGTQGKIDKAEAEKQVTIWRQEMYREIISNLNSFQNSFFGSSSSTNLMSSEFFNAMSAVTASKAFSAIASTGAASGKTSVQVAQIATSSKVQSGSAVSGTLSGEMDLSALERRVVLSVDGKEVEIQLTVDSNASEADKQKEIAKQINDKLTGEGITSVTAAIDDKGILTLSGGEVSVSAKSSKLGLDTLGLTAGKKSVDGSLTSTVKADTAASFTMTLNGLKRTITLDGVDKSSDLQKELQTRINNAFGSGWVTVGVKDGEFTLKANGEGNVVSISGDKSGLALLGVKDGESNKISNGQMLKDMNFVQKLEGDRFSFQINDVSFSFSGETTLSQVMKKINSSAAGVRVTYSDIEDKFTIESSNTGAGHSVRMEQSEGNLLNVLFGDANVATGNKVTGSTLVSDTLGGSTEFGMGVSSFTSGYFRFTVDGTGYSIHVPQKADKRTYTRDEVMTLVNEGLASRFGYVDGGTANSVTDDIQAIELVGNSTDGYRLEVRNGAKVSFDDATAGSSGEETNKALDMLAAGGNLQAAFGFNNASNVVSETTKKLSEVGIKGNGTLDLGSGRTISYTEGDTIETLLQKINAETGTTGITASFEDGRITFGSTKQGDVQITGELTKLFGTDSLSFGQTQGNAAKVTEGQNAIVSVNGVTVQRSSNTFTVNGLTLSLTDATGSVSNERLTKSGDEWVDASGNRYAVDKNGAITTEGDKKGWIIDPNGYLSEKGELTLTGEAETITTTRNTDQIFDGIKSFVDKYNEMIEKLNKLVDAEATYKDYSPLTSAQKKDMSDKEIELWEEKAKEGLLRKDDSISSFLSSMRSILYTKPAGSAYALYQVGIETSSEWKDKGKLVIDEAKLKEMIESNPQALQDLFSNAEEGLAVKMNQALSKTASTSSGSQGTLVSLAGASGKASSVTNTLTKKLISLSSRIKELKNKYEKEKSRYWRQFNSMETALSNLNTQSGWLTQQFS